MPINVNITKGLEWFGTILDIGSRNDNATMDGIMKLHAVFGREVLGMLDPPVGDLGTCLESMDLSTFGNHDGTVIHTFDLEGNLTVDGGDGSLLFGDV